MGEMLHALLKQGGSATVVLLLCFCSAEPGKKYFSEEVFTVEIRLLFIRAVKYKFTELKLKIESLQLRLHVSGMIFTGSHRYTGSLIYVHSEQLFVVSRTTKKKILALTLCEDLYKTKLRVRVFVNCNHKAKYCTLSL